MRLGRRPEADPQTAAEVARSHWLERRAREALCRAGWDASTQELAAVIKKDGFVEPEDRGDVLRTATELRDHEQAVGRHHYSREEIEAYMAQRVSAAEKQPRIDWLRELRTKEPAITVRAAHDRMNAHFGIALPAGTFYGGYWSHATPDATEAFDAPTPMFEDDELMPMEAELAEREEEEDAAEEAPEPSEQLPDPPPFEETAAAALFPALAELQEPLVEQLATPTSATGNGNSLPPIEIIRFPANAAAAVASSVAGPADAPAPEPEPTSKVTAAAMSPAAGARLQLETPAGTIAAEIAGDGGCHLVADVRLSNRELLDRIVAALWGDLFPRAAVA